MEEELFSWIKSHLLHSFPLLDFERGRDGRRVEKIQKFPRLTWMSLDEDFFSSSLERIPFYEVKVCLNGFPRKPR